MRRYAGGGLVRSPATATMDPTTQSIINTYKSAGWDDSFLNNAYKINPTLFSAPKETAAMLGGGLPLYHTQDFDVITDRLNALQSLSGGAAGGGSGNSMFRQQFYGKGRGFAKGGQVGMNSSVAIKDGTGFLHEGGPDTALWKYLLKRSEDQSDYLGKLYKEDAFDILTRLLIDRDAAPSEKTVPRQFGPGYAKGGQVKRSAAQSAKSLPFGVLKLLMQDVPMGLALAPAAVVGAPKAASWLANKAIGTPVLDYDVSKNSGYDYMEDKTNKLVEQARALLGVPKPEPFSPEYFGELMGSLAIPAGPMAELLGTMGKAGKYLSPVVDMAVAPHTKTGKALVASMMMAPDALKETNK